MKKLFLISAACAIIFPCLLAGQSSIKETSVTVYNNNIGVVREVRSIDIPKGKSDLRIANVPKEIIPATVKIKLDGQVLEQNYRYDVANIESILNRYIDKNITLTGDKSYSGKLISINDLDISRQISVVLEQADGSLTLIPSAEKYQISLASMPEGFVTRPTLFWSVNSNKQGSQDVELAYQTSEMNWNAEYILVLNEDDTRAELQSWVSVKNESGANFRDAKLKLVAGNVRRVNRDVINPRKSKLMAKTYECENVIYDKAPIEVNFSEAPLFEYHLYELERPTTLSDRETKQIALFNSDGISIEKKINYSIPNRNETSVHPLAAVEFVNSTENGLGNPIPEGNFQVMKKSGNGKELVGESTVKHTPKDEKIKLTLGEVFDVVVDSKIVTDKIVSKQVHEKEFSVTVKNHKTEPTKLDLIKYVYGSVKVISCSENWEKENASTIRIPIEVEAESETTVTLKIRTRY